MSCAWLRNICLAGAWALLVYFAAAIGLLVFLDIYRDVIASEGYEHVEPLHIGTLFFILYMFLNTIRLGLAVILIKGIMHKCRTLIGIFIYGTFFMIFLFVAYTVVEALWDLRTGRTIQYDIFDFILDGLPVCLMTVFSWPVSIHYHSLDSRLHQMDDDDEEWCYDTVISMPMIADINDL